MSYKAQEGVDYIVDLYALIGAERGAPEADIKTALNERAMEYHPDRLQGTATEFQEKAERIARLLNRARGILLDTDNRAEYDDMLSSWDGPLSTDGTPIISMTRLQETEFLGMSPEEVETHFAEYTDAILTHTGYKPSRLAFIEKMIKQSGGDVSDELRAEYEDALLQKDRTLALEEVERSNLLGLPDIEEQNYVATLEYGEETSRKIDEARTTKKAELRRLAIGGVGTLAILAGEPLGASTDMTIVAEATLELPAYYEPQAARVQEIANEREDITEKRLNNFEPTYPEAELQVEPQEDLIIGVAVSDGYMWIGVKVDAENDSAEPQGIGEDIKTLLNEGEYTEVISKGNGLLLLQQMEHIDIQDLLGVAIAKYTDKYKQSTSE